MRRRLLLAALLSVHALACATGGAGPRERDAARRTLEALVGAENAGNVPLILAQFTDDAVILPDRQPAIVGIGAIADHYRRLVAEQRLESAIRLDELEMSDRLAVARGETIGSLVSKATGGETRTHDRWLAVLRRSGDEWLIARFAWQRIE